MKALLQKSLLQMQATAHSHFAFQSVSSLWHTARKTFGWFGGYGLEGTGQWMASIGLGPGMLMAFLAGSAEFFGGLFILLGLLTRLRQWL